MNTEDKIRRLTQNQAKVLNAIVAGTATLKFVSTAYISNATGLTGRALGGTVSALERNNFIQPLGRNNRQFNWELYDPELKQFIQKKHQKQIFDEILNKISGEK